MNKKELAIVLLAGGRGTRMQPLTTHKTMFPFMGTPMIEYALVNIRRFDPSQTVLIVHPSAQHEIRAIADRYGAQVYVQENAAGMSGAVMVSKDHIGASKALLIADAVTMQEQSAYAAMSAAVEKANDSINLAYRNIDTYKHGGYFAFDKKGKPESIIEKPAPDSLPSTFFKLVLDYYPRAGMLWEALEDAQSQQDDHYEQAVSLLMKKSAVNLVELTGDHASLKHAPRVLDVMEFCLKHNLKPSIDSSAAIAASAVIEGNVFVGRNVRIFENAVIKGPAYIGENTVIGNGVLVRESCIERDCEVGFNSEVARSYVGPGTKCHTSYIGDSIIEGEANLAAGSITANLRFDSRPVLVHLPSGKTETHRRKFGAILARGVKTAVHTSLMPGTVIAQGVQLPPALMYKGLIQEDHLKNIS